MAICDNNGRLGHRIGSGVSETVFSIPELFENVLAPLSAPDLLNVYLTAPHWASQIEASPTLSRHLYLAPEQASEGWTYDICGDPSLPSFPHFIRAIGMENQRDIPCPRRTVYATRLNPSILSRDAAYDPYQSDSKTCIFGSPNVQDITQRAVEGEIARLLTPELRLGTSSLTIMQRMLLTQPPCTRARVSLYGVTEADAEESFLTELGILNGSGLRLTDVQRGLEGVSRGHIGSPIVREVTSVRLELIGVIAPSNSERVQIARQVAEAESGELAERLKQRHNDEEFLYG